MVTIITNDVPNNLYIDLKILNSFTDKSYRKTTQQYEENVILQYT